MSEYEKLAAALDELHNRALGVQYRLSKGRGKLTVSAFVGKDRVGHIRAWQVPGASQYDVVELFVDESYQRRGIAGAMWARLRKAACEQGVKALRSQGYQRSSQSTAFWRNLVANGLARADGRDFYADC